MARSSAKGYVEPIAALAAVFAVVVGITVYAGVVGDVLEPSERAVAKAVLEDVLHRAEVEGVLDPAALAGAEPPAGWRANVTLATGEGRWRTGPDPPDDADRATRQVPVRLGPGTVRPGRITVVAWR